MGTKSIAKQLAQEAWHMLPDKCKEIMKDLEISYKESLSADIEHALRGNHVKNYKDCTLKCVYREVYHTRHLLRK